MKRKNKNQDGKAENKGEIKMLSILKECMKENRVASFYFNKEDHCKHNTGFVIACNEDEFLVAHINARGEYDGFIRNRLEDVYRIEYGGDYEHKISQLYQLKNQSHPVMEIDPENLLFSLLEHAKQNQLLVTFEMEDESVVGYVASYDDYISLDEVDFYGRSQGKSIIDINELTVLACDGDDEQDLKLIHAFM